MIIKLTGATFSTNIGNISELGQPFTVTVNCSTTGATIKLEATGQTTITSTNGTATMSNVPYGTTVKYTVTASGYVTQSGSVSSNKTITVSLVAVGGGGDTPGGDTGGGNTGVDREFTLTSSMLTNKTYSTTTAAWKDSTKHLATDFLTLYSGYDVVFDLPDTMEGYVAHLYQEKDGSTLTNKTSVISSWVQKGIVSTGPTSDKYFIVIQKKNKGTITPDEYMNIVGSIKVQKPTTRTITLDNTLMNKGKGYMSVNIVDDPDRIASWFYALTPGSTVTGNIADGLQAYIMSIRENDSEFSVDTSWVTSFNQTYNEACSIYIVAKYTAGGDFEDTNSWTSPLTINIK